jgi:hypothetical protein
MGDLEKDTRKIYHVWNRVTGQHRYQVATNAQDACAKQGWMIGDCYIVPVTPRYTKVDNGTPDLLYQVPCRTCSYQYAICKRPYGAPCQLSGELPTYDAWLRRAVEAHQCPHVGDSLSKEDYERGITWLPFDLALAALESG